MREHFKLIDQPTFFGALLLLVMVTAPLALFPEQGAFWIGKVKLFMTDTMGVLYLILGVAAVFFMTYVIFSDIGQIKLGYAKEQPEFNTASWAAMLFCGGIGASILYWGTIEWAYYYQEPPFQAQAGTEEAVQWASTYGIFHWGPVAWCIYMIPALPMAYFFHVRKNPVLKVSAALMPVIGEDRSKGWIGKSIDVLFIFGLLGGAATTLGLAAPLISEGLSYLTGMPITNTTQIGVLFICTVLFAYSSYQGMDDGIKLLSNINFWFAIALLLFVLVAGPTLFIIETGLDAIGRMLSNFFMMASWTEPFGGYGSFEDKRFPQDWTIFYWAWWLVFAPSMGLFVARISKGRTIKQMVAGAIFFGSAGCAVFFIVLGNYGLSLQLSGALDVVSILNDKGATFAIYSILQQLPFSYMVIVVFTLLCIIFTATTFDSISFILASVVQNNVSNDPMRWNRLFWAFTLSVMPSVLLFMGGLETLQTAAIVGGLPLLVISVMLMVSAVKATLLDISEQEGYETPVINIEDLPEVDPWSNEGIALARFESLRDIATDAVNSERETMAQLLDAKRRIRAYALTHDVAPEIPSELQAEVARLTALHNNAVEQRTAASEAAQQARSVFNALIRERDALEKAVEDRRLRAERFSRVYKKR